MSTLTMMGPRIYLAATDEDLGEVLHWLDTIKNCALDNASRDASLYPHPPTTTFKFPLPPCMTVEVEKHEGGI